MHDPWLACHAAKLANVAPADAMLLRLLMSRVRSSLIHALPSLADASTCLCHPLAPPVYKRRHDRNVVQYLIVAGVAQVFSEPTSATREYLSSHLKLLCHVPGPHCGGTPDELSTPIAAVHVRRGGLRGFTHSAPTPNAPPPDAPTPNAPTPNALSTQHTHWIACTARSPFLLR